MTREELKEMAANASIAVWEEKRGKVPVDQVQYLSRRLADLGHAVYAYLDNEGKDLPEAPVDDRPKHRLRVQAADDMHSRDGIPFVIEATTFHGALDIVKEMYGHSWPAEVKIEHLVTYPAPPYEGPFV